MKACGRAAEPSLKYLAGFGNEQQSEAIPGTLPQGQNAPQSPRRASIPSSCSGSPFTRGGRRTTFRLYRVRPSAMHPAFSAGSIAVSYGRRPMDEMAPSPNRLRGTRCHFRHAVRFRRRLVTIGTNGDAAARNGIGIHLYRATRPMTDRGVLDADGDC